MDQQLKDLMGERGTKGRKADITFLDGSGRIEVKGPGGVREYTLKPLKELYAAGTDSPSVNPEDDKYMPLFLGIEGSIAAYYEDEPGLTDGMVGLTLDQLAMDPDSVPAGDELA